MRLRLYFGSVSDHVRRGEYRSLTGKAAQLLYSETPGIMIRKDLAGGLETADAKRQPQIRRASTADVHSLVSIERKSDQVTDADELWQLRFRRHVVDTIGVGGCFVADVADSGPSFMQYLFTAEDNDRLQSSFPGLYPILGADEAMVEFLYIAPESRNPGVAVSCLRQVAEMAHRRGAASVISCIDPTNKGALFVNHLAGFRAQSIRRSKRRYFHTTYSFEDWPADIPRSLGDLASGRTTVT